MPKRRQTGQTATPQAAASPAIVSTVDEVNLDMVVHDKQNKPVLDLKPEDVTVTDLVPGDTTLRSAACHRSIQGTAPGHAGPRSSPPFGSEECSDIAAKILRMIPENGFVFSVLAVGGRLMRFQAFTSDRVALGKAIALATERTEPTNEDGAALPEKNLISVAQTGTDSWNRGERRRA
jgi:hypothetical protein